MEKNFSEYLSKETRPLHKKCYNSLLKPQSRPTRTTKKNLNRLILCIVRKFQMINITRMQYFPTVKTRETMPVRTHPRFPEGTLLNMLRSWEACWAWMRRWNTRKAIFLEANGIKRFEKWIPRL